MAFRVNWIFYLSVCVVLLALLADDTEAKGGRGGGGSRGGSRGGYRGGSRSTSRSTSRSSSGSSSSRSTSRGGSRLSSAYVTSSKGARYSRVYRTYRGYYYSYYSLYFYYSGTYGYRTRQQPSGDTQVCVNYEANENGTYLGVFACPLPIEPNNFTQCCGQDYAEYCCLPADNSGTYIAVGVVIAVIIIIIVAVFIACKVKEKKKRREQEAVVTFNPPVMQPTPQPGGFPGAPVSQGSAPPYSTGPAAYQPNGEQAPPYTEKEPFPEPTSDGQLPYPADGPAMPLPSYGVSSPEAPAPYQEHPVQAPPYELHYTNPDSKDNTPAQ